jgi:prevent-host-death family protein
MNETPISVTVAARKFSECINRVRYQGTSFLLEKNGVPVARLIPVQQNFGSNFEQLAATLRQTRKTVISNVQSEGLSVKAAFNDPEVKPEQRHAKSPKRRTLNW